MSASFDVRLVNFDRMLRALKESDEIAFKEIKKAMKDIGDSVKKEASKRMPNNPVSNWGPWTDGRTGNDRAWRQSKARRMSSTQRQFNKRGQQGLAYVVSTANGNDIGSIFALMGSGTRTTTPQGEHLVQAINSRFPMQHWKGSGKPGPRTLVEAYYAAKPEGTDEEIARKIANALERAMN